MTDAQNLLEVSDLTKHYPVRSNILRRVVGKVYAVDGVSFTLGVGETLGLVGEFRLRQINGRAKHSTSGRAVRRHHPAGRS